MYDVGCTMYDCNVPATGLQQTCPAGAVAPSGAHVRCAISILARVARGCRAHAMPAGRGGNVVTRRQRKASLQVGKP